MLELTKTFVHLRDDGGAEPIEVTPRFWRDSAASAKYDRVVAAIDFAGPEDLHSSQQEVHPEGDELIYVVAGAIDVVLDTDGGRRTESLAAGQAAIVPRGVWHHLVAREPGRLLFVNCRTGMGSRAA